MTQVNPNTSQNTASKTQETEVVFPPLEDNQVTSFDYSICKDYKSGEYTQEALAKKYNTTLWKIKVILMRNGLTREYKTKSSFESSKKAFSKTELCKDYKSGLYTQRDLAVKYNTSLSNVYRILTEARVKPVNGKLPKKQRDSLKKLLSEKEIQISPKKLGFWGHIKEAFKSLTH